ncbi:mitochondrial dicarboxylate carrier [Phascolarctos cinereus]
MPGALLQVFQAFYCPYENQRAGQDECRSLGPSTLQERAPGAASGRRLAGCSRQPSYLRRGGASAEPHLPALDRAAVPGYRFRESSVHLQTQHRANIGFAGMTVRVISVSGFMALYSGLSACVDRVVGPSNCWILFGSRMQNDVKMPVHLRRNYSHVLNGMTHIIREEGFSTLFSGATLASGRGALMTVGQASCYDQIKQLVLTSTSCSDSLSIHIIASFIAGLCATLLCQPLDVLKTRMMNAQDYDSIIHCVSEIAKLGPLAFYKGMFPAAICLIPHTILTFVFLEQLRLNFGIPIKTGVILNQRDGGTPLVERPSPRHFRVNESGLQAGLERSLPPAQPRE